MLVILMSIHIIGAIITIVIHCRDGTMEHASKYGDGFRFAKPSDVIFQDCLLWEIQLVIHTITFVEDYINSQFSEHFHWTNQFKNSKTECHENYIKIETNKRINKCRKNLYGWNNSIPLDFYTQKSLIIHRCLYKLTSVFRPFGRLDRLFY